MARYIDADKIDFSPLKGDFDRARAKVIIMGQPTADVVEVVRCKDCKRFMPYEGEEHKGDCEEFSELNCCVYEYDFCSYGERKDT